MKTNFVKNTDPLYFEDSYIYAKIKKSAHCCLVIMHMWNNKTFIIN
jgi:hypothetical protein